jgi:hypothetical protein
LLSDPVLHQTDVSRQRRRDSLAAVQTEHTDRKHRAAAIFHKPADNVGKIEQIRRIIAYPKLNGDFLPVSSSVADFGDVDFQQ